MPHRYVYGFPITGAISHPEASPETDAPDTPPPISPEAIIPDVPDRFRIRSVRMPHRSDVARLGAIAHSKCGWIAPPRPLNAECRFTDAPNFAINNTFRCAVSNGPKIRGCRDLLAHGNRRSRSPLIPIPWRIAQISSDFAVFGRDLAHGKAGEPVDYQKKETLFPPDAFTSDIPPRWQGGGWFGFSCARRFLVPSMRLFTITRFPHMGFAFCPPTRRPGPGLLWRLWICGFRSLGGLRHYGI